MLFLLAWSRTYAPDPGHSRNQVDGADVILKGEKDDDIANTKNSAKKNVFESYKPAGTK